MNNSKGCLLSKVDVRDYKLAKASSVSLPDKFEVDYLPPVKNQGAVGSCVAHATSSILEYHDMKEVGTKTSLSTNFIYGIQKSLCGHDGPGMYLRDALKIVQKYGDMLEECCPGNNEVPKAHSIAEKALENEEYLKYSAKFKIDSYVQLRNSSEIKQAILNYGPVLASIKWYDTFETNRDGVLIGNQSGDYGYHAIMIYGWNSTGFLCQNSWGTLWGNMGRFILPYSIPVAEARSVVDAESIKIVRPHRNTFLDIVYKIINIILNMFRK